MTPGHIKSAGGRPSHSILYFAIKKYFDAHKIIPDDAALRIEVEGFCEAYASEQPALAAEVSSVYASFVEFRKGVDAKSEPLAYKIIQTIADKYIHKPAISELLNTALMQETISGLGKQISELEAQVSNVSGTRSKNMTSMHDTGDVGDRVTTGIPWIDARLGRGAGPLLQSVIGIIAGQGVGKTSLGIHLGVSQALQERHALLVLAEEGMTKTVKRRILSCATGITTVELEESKDDLKVAAAKHSNPIAIAEKLAAMDKYLHVLDLVNNPGGLEAVLKEISALKSSGKNLTYVYVDWAGPIAATMVAIGYNGMQFKNRYDALKTLGSELALTASRTNTIIAVSQQMSGAQFKKGWFAESDQYCAMDCSTFTEMFKYVIVINPKDPKTNLSWLKIAKARDDPAGVKVIVRLRGELAQFYDVTNDYTASGKNAGFKKKFTTDSSVPQDNHA